MPLSKLLVVGEDQSQIDVLCNHLEPSGYTTICFTSPAVALTALREEVFDLVLTDLNMSEMDGIEFLRAAREIDTDLVGIMMVPPGAIDHTEQTMEPDALDYIVKPFMLPKILPVLARALAVRRLRLENIHLQQAVAIYELSMVIQLTLGFDSVLQKVADAAMGHAQVSGVSILVPTGDGSALRVAVSRGDNAARDEGTHIPFSESISLWVDRSLKRVSRLNELADMEASLPLSLFQLPGSVSIAMLAGDRFVGVLNFTPKNPGRPTSSEEIKALNILAGAAASALQAAALLEQLQSAEQRYRSFTEHAADIIIRYDLYPQPHVAYVNPAFASVMGYSPDEYYADPGLILKIVHPDDRTIKEAVLSGDFLNGSTVTLRCVDRKGKTIWIEQRNTRVEDSEGRLIAIEGIARDITERQKLEDQLCQSQKMETVGLLAGGLAHDFNNMLTVIIGYADLILSDEAPTVSLAKKIGQVKRAAELAAVLTGQLLALGHRQIVRRRQLDVNPIVENSVEMLRRSLGGDIELLLTLESGLGLVMADPGQIEQALMNLVLNAKDSMPRGGKVTIETKNVSSDELYLTGTPAEDPDLQVMIAVTDTGCGMDAAVQARIFEPFYTMKLSGKGTGLGLAVVHGIVKQSAGDIRVFSEPGRGTRFEILLPRSKQIEEMAGVEIGADLSTLASAVQAGSVTILVVEDDAVLRELIAAVLRKTGYDVQIARDGSEALRICEKQEGRIDLILTDMIMPGMSGPKLVESLMPFKRGMKVLYMSGSLGEKTAGEAGLDLSIPFIQKPFTPADLIGRIREILGDSIAPHEMKAPDGHGSSEAVRETIAFASRAP